MRVRENLGKELFNERILCGTPAHLCVLPSMGVEIP